MSKKLKEKETLKRININKLEIFSMIKMINKWKKNQKATNKKNISECNLIKTIKLKKIKLWFGIDNKKACLLKSKFQNLFKIKG